MVWVLDVVFAGTRLEGGQCLSWAEWAGGMYLHPLWSVCHGRPHYPTFPLFSSWFLGPIYATFAALVVVMGLADV